MLDAFLEIGFVHSENSGHNGGGDNGGEFVPLTAVDYIHLASSVACLAYGWVESLAGAADRHGSLSISII